MIATLYDLQIIVSGLDGKVVFDSKKIMEDKFLNKRGELQITRRNSKPRIKIWTTRENNPVYLDPSEAGALAGKYGEASIIYFAPVSNNGGKPSGQMMLVQKMESLDEAISSLRSNIIIFLAIWFVIASAMCASLISFTISNPLNRLSKIIEMIGQRNFTERIELNSNDEISALGQKINTTAYNLEKAFSEINERNEGLVHMASELEARNQELNKKQRNIEFDLRLAHKIQQELLPQVYPRIDGLHISAANFQVGEVGGDCFDFYKLGDTRLGAFIGDVSGKGISAALVMSMVTILFSQLKDQFPSPSEILGKVNEIMFRHFGSQHSIYLTCFFITVDVESREIIYSCAGHNPPFLFRPSTGEVIELEAEGFGLGMFNAVSYEEKRMQVQSGDKIILYTDGVVDSRNSEGTMFGYERLVQMVRENPSANSYRLTHFLVEELEEFAGNVKRQDDLTLLVLEVEFKNGTAPGAPGA